MPDMVGGWILAVVLGAGSPASLHEVRRVVDRAFTAELAGDVEGASEAVRRFVRSSELTSSARAWAERYLDSLEERRAALLEHGPTLRGYAEAFATLEGAPARWGDLYWARATASLPELTERLRGRSVRVRPGRTQAIEPEAVRASIRSELEKHGLSTEEAGRAPMTLVFDLDASDESERRGRWRVSVESSYRLQQARPQRGLVGVRVQRAESERSTKLDARRLAVRRAVLQLVDDAVYDLRLALLQGTLSRPRTEPERP